MKFLFNMVDVIGFRKTKEQSLLSPTEKLKAFLVWTTQKSYDVSFISELEHLPQKVGPAGRPFLF